MSTKHANKHISLKKLKEIKDNNYLSEDCKTDYDKTEVDNLIILKESKDLDKKHDKEIDQYNYIEDLKLNQVKDIFIRSLNIDVYHRVKVYAAIEKITIGEAFKRIVDQFFSIERF